MKDPVGGEPWAFLPWPNLRLGRHCCITRICGEGQGRVPVHPFNDLTLDAKLGNVELSYRPGQVITLTPGSKRPIT